MRRRNMFLGLVILMLASFMPFGAVEQARADLPGFIVRVWSYRWGGLWRTEYRYREIARWYRHYSWVTNQRLWLKRRAEGVWITGQAVQQFTSRSHCILRSPNGTGVWRIWRTFTRTDIRRYRAHYRVLWPGWVNGVMLDAAPPGDVVGGLNARFQMTMDHLEVVLPMEPGDPNPGTPWNENVMIMDEHGQVHFLGEPGFEQMPDTAMNPNGFTLATTAFSTHDLPPAEERIIDPPMTVMPGSGKVQIAPGVIVQWLVNENGDVVVPGDPTPVNVTVSGPGGPITDLGVLERSVFVPETCPIELVQLSLQGLQHTWAGDLIATLTGPNGVTATMFHRIGQNNVGSAGDSSDFGGNYLMGDVGGSLWQQAAALPAAGVIPSGGYYNVGAWQNVSHNPPNGPPPNTAFTTAFNGINPQGNWTLRITDNAGGDVGNLASWTLNLGLGCPGPAPHILDDRVLGGQKHQMLMDQPTGIDGHELDLDEANVPLQLHCWMLAPNGEIFGAFPGQVVIGPPRDADGIPGIDPQTAFGGPIPMNPTVRDDHDILAPGMAPVDFAVVEEDAPTPAELAAFNNLLAAAGIPPVFPPFQMCINRVTARHIWGIDRRFVMDCWRHHWYWYIRSHFSLTGGTNRIWITRSALEFFNYSGHHFVAGLPPAWRMMTLVNVRFFRVCYRVFCPRPNIVRVRIEQVYVVLPQNPDDPNSDLMLLTTESNENALLQINPAVLAGLQPDPLPVGPDGVAIIPLDPVLDTLDMGGGGTNIMDGDLNPLAANPNTMQEVVMVGNNDFAQAMRNNQLQLYCWPLAPDGTVKRTTFIPECVPGQGCHLPDEQGHGAQNIVGAASTPSVAFVMADNFRVTGDHPIRHVCWWGTYFNFNASQFCTSAAPDDFTITYYNDAGGFPGAIRAGPFPVLASRVLTPRIINPGGLNLPVYAYQADHPPVNALPGECLWVSVQNNVSPSCVWIWNTADPGDGRSVSNLTQANDFDMAFCIDVPIAANDCFAPVPRPSKQDMEQALKDGFLIASDSPLRGPGMIETITFTEDPAPAMPAFEDDMGNPMPNPTMTSFFMSAESAVPVCCVGNADKIAPGQVNFADITATLANFGMPANPNGTSVGDSNCDGTINFGDITATLANFLASCP